TANAVCSVSLTPPLLLVCVDKSAESHPAMQRSRVFAADVLALEHDDLSARFSVSGGDKFVDVPHRAGVTGAPLLDGALATAECRGVAGDDAGDPTISVGEDGNG